MQDDISPEDKQMLQWVVAAVESNNFRFHHVTGETCCAAKKCTLLLLTCACTLQAAVCLQTQMILIWRQRSQLVHSRSSSGTARFVFAKQCRLPSLQLNVILHNQIRLPAEDSLEVMGDRQLQEQATGEAGSQIPVLGS